VELTTQVASGDFWKWSACAPASHRRDIEGKRTPAPIKADALEQAIEYGLGAERWPSFSIRQLDEIAPPAAPPQ
jgi:hypothetical protein